MNHILACENCGGDVHFHTNSKRGAVGMMIGGALMAPLGPVGMIFGGLGGARMTGGGGGKCEQCGAVYGRDAINFLREKALFTLPATKSTQQEAAADDLNCFKCGKPFGTCASDCKLRRLSRSGQERMHRNIREWQKIGFFKK